MKRITVAEGQGVLGGRREADGATVALVDVVGIFLAFASSSPRSYQGSTISRSSHSYIRARISSSGPPSGSGGFGRPRSPRASRHRLTFSHVSTRRRHCARGR